RLFFCQDIDPLPYSLHASCPEFFLSFSSRKGSCPARSQPCDIRGLILQFFICPALKKSEITLPEHRFCTDICLRIDQPRRLNAALHRAGNNFLNLRITVSAPAKRFHRLLRQALVSPSDILFFLVA